MIKNRQEFYELRGKTLAKNMKFIENNGDNLIFESGSYTIDCDIDYIDVTTMDDSYKHKYLKTGYFRFYKNEKRIDMKRGAGMMHGYIVSKAIEYHDILEAF